MGPCWALVVILTPSVELSEAASQPSALRELEKPNHRSCMCAGGVGACHFCTATGERREWDSACQTAPTAPAPLVSVQLPGLCHSPSASLSDGAAMALHCAFNQMAKLRALALSLTSLELSSKCKGVAQCSWVHEHVWHGPE